jgi:hypothetical protein
MSNFESSSTFIFAHTVLEAINRNCSRVDKQTRAELESEAFAIDDTAVLLNKRAEALKRHGQLAFSPQSAAASPSPFATDKVARAEEDARQERAIQAAETQAQAMTRQARAAERQAEAEEERAQAAFLNALNPPPRPAFDPVFNMMESSTVTTAPRRQPRSKRKQSSSRRELSAI